MTIIGTIDFIRYQNPANGWVIATLVLSDAMEEPVVESLKREEGTAGLVTVAGFLPGIKKGMSYRLDGDVEASKYGPTFKFTSWSEYRPVDVDGIEKYLASGLIQNIGPKYAKLIVGTFGEKTLDVMDNCPERLREIKGIGKTRVESIIAAVKEQREIRDIMIWLKSYDIPNGLAVKIFEKYKGNAIAILEENPYRLVDDIGGVGFKKADEVALKLGIAPSSPFRLRSGVLAVLRDAADDEGHTCMPSQALVDRAACDGYLGVNAELVKQTLQDPEFLGVKVILNEEEEYALPMYHFAERGIAHKLLSLLSEKCAAVPMGQTIASIEQAAGIVYTDEQREAIRIASCESVLVLTGGPGTGKTATTNAIIRNLEENGLKVRLAAPTGRAAKRMTEVTGHQAMTIHRLLGWSFGAFTHDNENPLEGDVFIIDEASMIDTLLMNSLLKAIPERGRLILVGDVDQLPSVGAGAVLLNIIESGKVPTVRLTKIHRQAQSSRIVTNAHRINQGVNPELGSVHGSDFHFIGIATTDGIRKCILDLVINQIPKVGGIHPKDIQVLCPMRRDWDPIGATLLNKDLQALLNPDGKVAAKVGDTEFRIGDRIMQMKNNYEKDIFNGDIGVVREKAAPGREDKAVLVADFDGNLVYLSQLDLSLVSLAYACTIHKSQGSEYPAVIMPIHESNYIMLKRNLLYTGVTRARKLCIVVGTPKAVYTAVSREDTNRRWTGLTEKITNQP